MLTSWEYYAITFTSLFNAITQSKLKFSEKIKLLGHSGHIDEKKDTLNNIFRYLISLIWMI